MLLKVEWHERHNYSRNVSQIPTGHLLCLTDEKLGVGNYREIKLLAQDPQPYN